MADMHNNENIQDNVLEEIRKLRDEYKLTVCFNQLPHEENTIGYYISPRLLSYRVYEIKPGYELVHYCTTRHGDVVYDKLLEVIRGKVGIGPEARPEPKEVNEWKLIPGKKYI